MKPSLYSQLPEAVRKKVDTTIKEHNFANYDGMVATVNAVLQEHGLEVSFTRSTLHRVAQDLRGILDQIRYTQEAANYLSEAFPDDDRTVSQASIRLIQDRLFRVAMESSKEGGELTPKELSSIAKAMADLVRADITDSKYRNEVRSKTQSVADEVEAIAQGGLSEDAAAIIRKKILGIAS
jgi:hypothetical protein